MTGNQGLSRRATWAHGQPISDLMSRALSQPTLISLAAGFVDQATLPVEPVRAAMESLWADDREAAAALQYGTTPGAPALRQQLLDRFTDSNVCCHDPGLDQLVLTAGSNQLLHLVVESLVDPGDIILCTSPTYLVFLGTLDNVGARAVGVKVDQYGMCPESLEDVLRSLDKTDELRRVKAIYLVPYFDNPCGLTMPLKRRARIVELAQRWSRAQRIHVIADEAYRELRYEGGDVPSTLTVDDEADTVIVTNTFSKSFSPGIRIGWGILPKHLVGPVCDQKGNIDFGSPNFNQQLMARVLELNLFEPHLETIRAGYRVKLRAMLEACDQYLGPIDGVRWRPPQGGLYVWVTLPQEIATGADDPLFRQAIEEGVLYVPGEHCYPREGHAMARNTMRLSFGVQDPGRIQQGLKALSRAIRQVSACRV